MSGIAALIRFDGALADATQLEAMLGAMHFRGPDGTGQMVNGQAGIGLCAHHSLSSDPAANMPIANDDQSVVLALDGYLANFEELAAHLEGRGVQLRERCDSELILRGYEIWGRDVARHLDGEFSIVLWDRRRREAVCIRDHHGLRPLFYHWDGARLLVASEPAAIIAGLGFQPALNLAYVAQHAADQPCTVDETVWQGIMRVPAAQLLYVNGARLALEQYWTLPEPGSIVYSSDEEYFEHYRAMFADCVRSASRSPAPIACEVSGGLDSSAIFCMAHELQTSTRLLSPGLRGYTLQGPPGSLADEVRYAQAVADHTGTQITKSPLFIPEFDWFARQAQADMDFAPFPNAAMSLNLDRTAVDDGCRVVLTGVGGDQWLDGTNQYYGELFHAGQWRILAKRYREDCAVYGLLNATKLLLRLGPFSLIPPNLRSMLRGTLPRPKHGNSNAADWINPQFYQGLEESLLRYETQFPAEYRRSFRLRKLHNPRWPQILDQANRQRARAGLEMRSPMLSRKFIEFSASTPEHLRLRGGVSKFIHRQALTSILPGEIAQRKDKAEFSVAYFPHDQAVRDFCLKYSSERAKTLFNTDAVRNSFDAYRDTPIDERSTAAIWSIYLGTLMLWLDDSIHSKGTNDD